MFDYSNKFITFISSEQQKDTVMTNQELLICLTELKEVIESRSRKRLCYMYVKSIMNKLPETRALGATLKYDPSDETFYGLYSNFYLEWPCNSHPRGFGNFWFDHEKKIYLTVDDIDEKINSVKESIAIDEKIE